MDDLDNYRCRTGTFILSHHSVSRSNTLHRGRDNATSFIFKVAFLVCFSLAIFCSTQDPSIAKNPGPGQRDIPFPYTTAQEKTLFLQIRKLHKDRININSHALFPKNCLNNQVIPNGLLPTFSSAVARPNEDLNYKLELLQQNNSFSRMNVIISRYQGLLFKFDEQLKEVKGQLLRSSDSNR